jgi:hypothetical protein
MTVVFLFSMGLWRRIGAGAVKGVAFLIPRMAVLATSRSTHFLVTSRAGLVVCPLKTWYVIVVGGPALFAQGSRGERLGQMATPAGHAGGRATVLVAFHAIGILRQGAGRVVMAFGAVLDEHDMLGVVELYFIVKVHKDIEL